MLRTVPLLVGAALLFWGWQAGLFLFAGVMALMVEGSRVTSLRWEFERRDYDRIWNLCAILFIGVAIYCFGSNDGFESFKGALNSRNRASAALAQTTRSILLLFQWLPLIFFPIMLAQVYGSREKIDFSTFSWVVRRRLAGQTAEQAKRQPPTGVNVSFIYFGICLFAASAGKTESVWFLPFLGALIAAALFTQRPRRYAHLTWAATMLLTLTLGFGAQFGLQRLHRAVERLDSLLLSRFSARAVDASEARTAIGAIGKLSLSGRIVIRLQSQTAGFPDYLREASYNVFRSPYWAATRREFGVLVPETNDTTWILSPGSTSNRAVRIAQFLPARHRILAAPTGLGAMRELPVFQLETNRFGALKAEEGPGFVDYISHYDVGHTIDGPPDEDDLRIPEAEEKVLSQVAQELGLDPGIDPAEALQKTTLFFDKNFQYSSYLAGQPPKGETALKQFLLRKRSGHCELFGTATALLLRKAGIPTRYAVGYSVQEIKGHKAVVRERHAHAWCLAYIDGVWRDVDTTPASWAAIENSRASAWQTLSDGWSQIWFAFSKWRYGQSGFRSYIPWFVAPVAIMLVAQLLWRRSARREQKGAIIQKPVWPGLESEFYQVELALAQRGYARRADEPILHWLARIKPALPDLLDSLPSLAVLHYRWRFDPLGLTPVERGELREAIANWRQRERSQVPVAVKN